MVGTVRGASFGLTLRDPRPPHIGEKYWPPARGVRTCAARLSQPRPRPARRPAPSPRTVRRRGRTGPDAPCLHHPGRSRPL